MTNRLYGIMVDLHRIIMGSWTIVILGRFLQDNNNNGLWCEPFINNPTASAPQRCAQSKGIFSNISVCKCICTGHEIVSGGQDISTRNIWEKKIYHLVSIGQEARTEKLPSSL